jgi:hypothetical protein
VADGIINVNESLLGKEFTQIVHFVPYGTYKTTCGVTARYDFNLITTDRRKLTTCPNCLGMFTDDSEE